MAGLVANVLRPGSREFVVALNAVLLLLFSVMLGVVYTELDDSVHVFVLLFLVVGLTVSINVFIVQANELKAAPASSAADKQQQQGERAKTD